jgi:hypothetical protein
LNPGLANSYFPPYILLMLNSGPQWDYLFKVSQICPFYPSLLFVHYCRRLSFYQFHYFLYPIINLIPQKVNKPSMYSQESQHFLAQRIKLCNLLLIFNSFISWHYSSTPTLTTTSSELLFPELFHVWFSLGLWILVGSNTFSHPKIFISLGQVKACSSYRTVCVSFLGDILLIRFSLSMYFPIIMCA